MSETSQHKPLKWVLPRLEAIAPEVFKQFYREDSCIAITRCIMDALLYFGIPVSPLPVKLRVFNAPYLALMASHGRGPKGSEEAVRWAEQGASEVAVGYGFDPGRRDEDRWDGHIVAYVTHHGLLIDGSISQTNRPEKGIKLPGILIAKTDRKFRKGREPLTILLQTPAPVGLRYEADLKNEGYLASPNWTRSRIEIMVGSRLIALIEQMEEVEDATEETAAEGEMLPVRNEDDRDGREAGETSS